jgi:hypothetical protein
MRAAATRTRLMRLGSLLAIGVFGLHQLRYLLSYGDRSGQQLAGQGHGYMADAAPILGGLALAVLAATLLGGLLGPPPVRRSPWRRAPAYAAAILAIYCCQELLEGALAAGHPAGPDALLVAAGWIAAPLALLFGAAVALVARLLEGVEAALGVRRRQRVRLLAPRSRGGARAAKRLNPLSSPLSFGLARRPPPAPAGAD